MATPTTYKVLDAEGAELTVKYTRGQESTVLKLRWDGVTDIDKFLGQYQPIPEAPDPVVDATPHIGKEGVATGTPLPPPPEPVT